MKCVGAQAASLLFGSFVNDKLKMAKVNLIFSNKNLLKAFRLKNFAL